jgi:hypothetical protein
MTGASIREAMPSHRSRDGDITGRAAAASEISTISARSVEHREHVARCVSTA